MRYRTRKHGKKSGRKTFRHLRRIFGGVNPLTFNDIDNMSISKLKKYFENLGFKEFFPMLSLDSIPRIDWDNFYKWKSDLYEEIYR